MKLNSVNSTYFSVLYPLVACILITASWLSAGDVHYAYDDLGRLTAVIDDAANTAVYNYDAVGICSASTASPPARVASVSMPSCLGKEPWVRKSRSKAMASIRPRATTR